MDLLRTIAAWLIACVGFHLFVTGTLMLTRAVVLRWAATLLGQHQGGGLPHGEGF